MDSSTLQTPRTTPELYKPRTQSSTHSTSTAPTEQLSTAYILTRTDETRTPATIRDDSTLTTTTSCDQPERCDDFPVLRRQHGQVSRQSNTSGFESNSYFQESEDDYGDAIATEVANSPPSMTYFPPGPSESLCSVNTYDSRYSAAQFDGTNDDDQQNESSSSSTSSSSNSNDHCNDEQPEPIRLPAADDAAIPAFLPPYCVMPTTTVRPSDPTSFSRLFPSMDRLAIRHDDTSSDGNMNLRVETVVDPSRGYTSRRRPTTVQLFHLRMRDLANRDFSFRRYCRDSGREVCFSKRAYASPATSSRPNFRRSVSSALHAVKAPFFRRSNTSSNVSTYSVKSASSSRQRSQSISTTTSAAAANSASGAAASSADSHKSPPNSRSSSVSEACTDHSVKSTPPPAPTPASLLVPTDTIKLEFSNYARVEVTARRAHKASSRCYDFEWWGHNYTWRRSVDSALGTVSFHLVRDGHDDQVVAHIVPEIRTPNQVKTEERDGGWVPPCYMWITSQAVVDAMTDVAEYVSTQTFHSDAFDL